MSLTEDNPIELCVESGIDVRELAEELQDPSLWNQHRLRTTREGPHRHVDDIWVRCLDWDVMREDPTRFNQPHQSTWYPVAFERLQEVRSIAGAILRATESTELGGVLITRIPAGCCVMPHIDQGWHARHYNKYAVQIQADDRQEFCFDRKRLITRAGDVFTFDNQYLHWVTNPATTDRITMIVCVRRDQPCHGE